MAACCWTCEGCVYSHRVVLYLVFGGESAICPCCRERSYARIDIVNFGGDMKWCLWKAC